MLSKVCSINLESDMGKKSSKTLREVNPEAAKMWDYDLNDVSMNPDNIGAGSDRKAFFRCLSNPNHVFIKKICKMTSDRDSHNIGCIYCGPNAKTPFPGDNDLLSVIPEAKEMWDYDKNELIPEKLFPKSNKKAYFKCSNNHSVLRKIEDFSRSPSCPECARENTRLLSIHPYTKDFWNFEKNSKFNIEDEVSSSRDVVYLKCPNCRYEWKSSITLWHKKTYCQCCGFDGTKGSIERNKDIIAKRPLITLRMKHPNIDELWDYEKNTDINPDSVLYASNHKAFFKCKNGHCFEKVIAEMTDAKGSLMECQYCKNKIDTNNLFIVCTEAKDMWDFELNKELNPEYLLPAISKKAHFVCKNGHKFIKRICDFARKPKCPECVLLEKQSDAMKPVIAMKQKKVKKEILKKEKIDLFSLYPIARDMWDFENNQEIDVENGLSSKAIDAWWICEKGHHFKRRIESFLKSQQCPACKKEGYSIANFNHMVKQWDFKKNTDIDINLTSAFSKRDAWWKCKKCGYEWQAQIATRRLSKGLCPCCENRTIVSKGITDLFSMVPEIKLDYDFKKNTDINPDELSIANQTSIWWRCHNCNYEWTSSPASRVKKIGNKYAVKNCPACIGVVRNKSYAEDYPNLAIRFIEEKNACRLTDLVGDDLYNKFWWHCDICGEEFQGYLSGMIRSRDTEFKGCPYCAGKLVKREKSFAALHPECMDEYDPANVIDPYEVSEGSNMKALWVCRNNSEHKWKATFYSRSKGIGGCSVCRGYHYNLMISEEHPEFEPFYDTTKNTRSFSSFSNKSNEIVWWKCEEGHSFQWQIYNFSRAGEFICPVCSDKLIVSGINDLATKEPELALEFDIERNHMLPREVSTRSTNDLIWWQCQYGHSFQRSPSHRINRTRKCPVCERNIVVKGINDMATTYPQIVGIWDFDANERTLESISDICNDKFAFKCNKGHHYSAYMETVKYNNFECLVCNGKIIVPGVNSLLDTDYELSLEFSPNETRKPTEFTKNSAYSVLWRCKKCNGDYHYPIKNRLLDDSSCLYCEGRLTMFGINSLIDTHPELAREYSNTNERDVKTIRKDSKIWTY